MRHRRLLSLLLALLAPGYLGAAASAAETAENAFASDPAITVKYLPGKYYEQRAQEAVEIGRASCRERV